LWAWIVGPRRSSRFRRPPWQQAAPAARRPGSMIGLPSCSRRPWLSGPAKAATASPDLRSEAGKLCRDIIDYGRFRGIPRRRRQRARWAPQRATESAEFRLEVRAEAVHAGFGDRLGPHWLSARRWGAVSACWRASDPRSLPNTARHPHRKPPAYRPSPTRQIRTLPRPCTGFDLLDKVIDHTCSWRPTPTSG
jgi:hypothetical protein